MTRYTKILLTISIVIAAIPIIALGSPPQIEAIPEYSEWWAMAVLPPAFTLLALRLTPTKSWFYYLISTLWSFVLAATIVYLVAWPTNSWGGVPWFYWSHWWFAGALCICAISGGVFYFRKRKERARMKELS